MANADVRGTPTIDKNFRHGYVWIHTKLGRTHGTSIHFWPWELNNPWINNHQNKKGTWKQYNYGHVSSTIVGLIITRIRKNTWTPIGYWPCELNNRWINKHQINENPRKHVFVHVGGRTVGWQGRMQHMFTWPMCVLRGTVSWLEIQETQIKKNT